MNLLILITIPAIIAGVAFYGFKVTITWKEFLLHLAVAVAFVAATWGIAKWGGMHDTEHWNGRITDVDNGTEGCCHSYECNCQTCYNRDAKGNVTSSYSCNCQTCYHHSHDYWWGVDISTGDQIHDGCNGSSSTPGWWKGAYVGEPASIAHSYVNYLKADPESLFQSKVSESLLSKVPSFPGIQGRYHSKKVIWHGVPAIAWWETEMRELNADLGSKKQIDVTVVVTAEKDPEFAAAIEQAWLYGPKNSFIIVLGIASDDDTIDWARTVTISKVAELEVEIRDHFQGSSLMDAEHPAYIRKVVERDFHRISMSEFEYLADAAEPDGWGLFFLYFLDLLVSIGLAVLMHKNDVFGDERRTAWRS